jgi:hypothetical protein
MFKADVYVDGVKTAYAQNDGRGGCTDYHAYEGKRDLLAKAEAFALTLPDRTHTVGDKTYQFKTNLESLIDDIVHQKAQEKVTLKANRKIQKLTLNHIVWGVPNGDSYQMLAFKGRPTFESVLKLPHGKMALENLIKRVKNELKPNEVIFNQNI